MVMWIAVAVVCIEANCRVIGDTEISVERQKCMERAQVLQLVAVQAYPQAVTIGGCIKLPLRVS